MPNKTIWFGVTGDEEIITQGVRTFAIATGWTETIIMDGEIVANTISECDHTSAKLYDFISEVVIAHNANLGAESGRELAINQTRSAYKEVTHELSIESV